MTAGLRRPGSVGAIRAPHTESAAAAPGGRLAAASLVLVVALSYATVAQGGFYPHQFRVVVVLVAVASALAVRGGGWRHPLPVALLSLAGVAVVSGWLHGAVEPALPTVGMAVVVAGAFSVARQAGTEERETLGTAVVVVGVLVAGAGLAGVVLRRPPLALVDEGLWRAASTLTYANAAAGLLLVPALISLGRAVAARSWLWSLTAFVLITGLLATLSRGGVVALGAGVLVLGALAGWRAVLSGLWAVFAGAGVALAGLVPSMPDRVPGRPVMAVVGLAAGAGVVVLGQRRRPALTAGVAAALALAGAVMVPRLELGLDGSTRVSAESSARLDGWRAAAGVVADEPLLGAGPGQASYTWVTDEGEPQFTRFVHNEYLQLAAETGVVGGAVLLVGLVLSARRLRRPTGTSHAATWAGGVAGLVAVLVHSGVDFLWHVPAVPLTAAVVAGLVSDPFRRVGADDPTTAGRVPEGSSSASSSSEGRAVSRPALRP